VKVTQETLPDSNYEWNPGSDPVPVNTDFEAYKSKPRLKQNEAAQSKRRV
jgi:hypothetical protein